jgi:hypothetical protein
MDFNLSIGLHIPPWLLLSACAVFAAAGTGAAIRWRLSDIARRAFGKSERQSLLDQN